MRNWNNKRIKDIGILKLGKMLTDKPVLGFHQRPYLKSKNVDWLTFKLESVETMFFSDSELKNLRLHKNDLVISEGGEVGKTALWQDELHECYIQNSVHKLTLGKECNPKYYLYLFFDFGHKGYFKSIVNLVSIMHLTYEKLRRIEVPVPPLEEQNKIVDFLDTKLSEIDHQVSLLTSKRDAYLRLKKNIINNAVTRGLDPHVKMKDSGIEWIGEVPKYWKACRFKDFLELCTTASANVKKIGLENIESQTGRFIETNSEFEGNGVAFKKNSIVYGKLRPYLQKVWVAEFAGNAVGDFFVFNVRKNAIPSYIKYVMLSDGFTKEADRSTVGAKMPRVSSNFILTLHFCMPPLHEQCSIAAYLDDKCSKIDTIITNLGKQISRYADLKRALINEVITGKRAV